MLTFALILFVGINTNAPVMSYGGEYKDYASCSKAGELFFTMTESNPDPMMQFNFTCNPTVTVAPSANSVSPPASTVNPPPPVSSPVPNCGFSPPDPSCTH
jgi:hypothetical protein